MDFNRENYLKTIEDLISLDNPIVEISSAKGGHVTLAEYFRGRSLDIVNIVETESSIPPAAYGRVVVSHVDPLRSIDCQILLNKMANLAGGRMILFPVIEINSIPGARKMLSTYLSAPVLFVNTGMLSAYEKFRKLDFVQLPNEYVGVANVPDMPLVTVCMPVKDEGDTLDQCLNSFLPIASEILISVDEKSSDSTAAIAAKYADKVISHRYEGDFSAIRNPLMDRAGKDWIWMSEGHVYLDPKSIPHTWSLDHIEMGVPDDCPGLHLRMEISGNIFFFSYLTRNKSYPDKDGTLVPMRYHGKTHNIVMSPYGRDFLYTKNISMLHARPVDASERAQKRRDAHNRRNLIEEARSFEIGHPLRHRAYTNLANQCVDEEKDSKAISYLRRIEDKKVLPGHEIYHAVLLHGMILQRQRKLQDAWKKLSCAAQYDLTRNEHWLVMSEIANELGMHSQAQLFAKLACVYPEPISPMIVRRSNYREDPWMILAMAESSLGNIEESLDAIRNALKFAPDDERILNYKQKFEDAIRNESRAGSQEIRDLIQRADEIRDTAVCEEAADVGG